MERFWVGPLGLSYSRGQGSLRDCEEGGRWWSGWGVSRGRRRGEWVCRESTDRRGLLCRRLRLPAFGGPAKSWGWNCYSLNRGLAEGVEGPTRAFPFPGGVVGWKWEEAVGGVQGCIVRVSAYQEEVRPSIVTCEREARVTCEK